MSWKDTIEKIGPDNLVEIPDPAVFNQHRKYFEENGFTTQVFNRLFPILEQQVWSIFQLFSLARGVPKDGAILEIGSGRGGSMAAIALGNLTATLTNIDPFRPYDETSAHGTVYGYTGFTIEDFKKNMAKFDDVAKGRITTIQEPSETAYTKIHDGSQDLIFVDGNHTYGPCKSDIALYLPKVKAGGILSGHDYHPRFPGVITAVKEAFGDNFEVLENSSIWTVHAPEAKK